MSKKLDDVAAPRASDSAVGIAPRGKVRARLFAKKRCRPDVSVSRRLISVSRLPASARAPPERHSPPRAASPRRRLIQTPLTMSAAGYELRGIYGTEPYWPEKKLKICVTGAGGFIASHLAKRLKEEGHHVVGCDWKRNEHMPVRSRRVSNSSLAAVLPSTRRARGPPHPARPQPAKGRTQQAPARSFSAVDKIEPPAVRARRPFARIDANAFRVGRFFRRRSRASRLSSLVPSLTARR